MSWLAIGPWDVVFYAVIILALIIGMIVGCVYLLRTIKAGSRQKDVDSFDYTASLADHFPGMAYHCLFDAHWTMKYVSKGTERLTGYPNASVVDNSVISFRDIIHPVDRSRVRTVWNEAVKNHEDVDIEYRIITKKRKTKWIRETGMAIYDDQGHVRYLEGYIQDISRMKHAITDREREKEKYRHLIEHDPDPVYINKDGRIAYANPACVRFFKATSAAELIGRHVRELLTEPYVTVYEKRLNHIKETMAPNARADYVFKALDGSTVRAEVTAAPFLEGDDLFIHVYMVDRTETAEARRRFKKIQKRTRDLVLNMSEGIGVFDGEGSIATWTLVFANRSFRSHVDEPGDRIIGRRLRSFLPSHDEGWFDSKHDVLNAPGVCRFELNRENNQVFMVSMFFNKEHELVMMTRDVTELRENERLIRRERDMLETVIDATDIAIWHWHVDTGEISINARWLTMLGHTEDTPDTLDYSAWERRVHPDDLSRVLDELNDHLEGLRDVYACEYRMKHRNGGYVWVYDRGRISKRDENDKPLVISGIHQDVTERIEKEHTLTEVSHRDHLTRLHNRRAFDEYRLKHPTRTPVTLAMIDVNNLKMTNDAFGHDYGDRLLKKVAGIFSDHVRPDHFIARTGGDEFVLIMPGMGEQEANYLLEDIKTSVAKLKTKGIGVSLSCGLSTSRDGETDLDRMYKEAEENMYADKVDHYRKHDVIEEMADAFFRLYPGQKEFTERLIRYAETIASRMSLGDRETDMLVRACRYHPLGKFGMDEKIIRAEQELNAREQTLLQSHPQIAYRMLVSSKKHQDLVDIILHQDEAWDGSGSPEGCSGTDIPTLARIIAVAKGCVTAGDASGDISPSVIRHLNGQRGKRYDPDIVDACVNER